jgi:hypothetical protein
MVAEGECVTFLAHIQMMMMLCTTFRKNTVGVIGVIEA